MTMRMDSLQWRSMTSADLPGVAALADRIHPSLPEDVAVFADRLHLFPQGCLVLDDGEGGCLGYAVGHPWTQGPPPKLDIGLGSLPQPADCFYLHDVVVAPEARGHGLAEPAVERLLELAAGYRCAALVSVYGTAPFWSRFGFVESAGRLPPGALASYGADARYMMRMAPV
ncbi:GNAT family N-acetyltransferase [Aurantimonas endophytica]|uniref:GNAT superfamily N-acetyltransferase n=1 Tax=Aurantimonas endophytica TaxID=1522175 RepID=A0A7W6MPF2_9HYPH|nr:GNAT family N-acetyltransferase [Aurantimonas endophytica]MBB4002807.1 GNAT superfamily N-acetyltransferase [Aurantimonas endophytica]